MLNGLDLFSGIGGLSLALKPWARTVAYCENDRYAQSVLLSRMRSGELCHAPIWDDVRTLRGDSLGNWIDIIFGGFPCQDISIAGYGAGLAGKRSGLFFEIVRLARELRPRFVFLENVPAITLRGLDRVLLEFTSLGYDCRWTVVSAGEMGAPHLRERWWLLAHANGARLPESGGQQEPDREHRRAPRDSSLGLVPCGIWKTSPRDICGMDDGLPLKTHRIRVLGNAVVPHTAREAFGRLAGVA